MQKLADLAEFFIEEKKTIDKLAELAIFSCQKWQQNVLVLAT